MIGIWATKLLGEITLRSEALSLGEMATMSHSGSDITHQATALWSSRRACTSAPTRPTWSGSRKQRPLSMRLGSARGVLGRFCDAVDYDKKH